MNVIKTPLEGVVIIEPRLFEDARGYFFESFSQREFDEKVCKTVFVQDNESKSCYGVVRALHLQKPPYTQSGAGGERRGAGCGGGCAQRFADLWPARGGGTDGG